MYTDRRFLEWYKAEEGNMIPEGSKPLTPEFLEEIEAKLDICFPDEYRYVKTILQELTCEDYS